MAKVLFKVWGCSSNSLEDLPEAEVPIPLSVRLYADILGLETEFHFQKIEREV